MYRRHCDGEISSWANAMVRRGMAADCSLRCDWPKLTMFSVIFAATRCWLPYDAPTKASRPVSSRKVHTRSIPPSPSWTNTKCSAPTSRCKNARPTGLSKKATNTGSASIVALRASQCRSVERGKPTDAANAR